MLSRRLDDDRKKVSGQEVKTGGPFTSTNLMLRTDVMLKDKEDLLYSAYPLLFRDCPGYLIDRGMACSTGWYEIIDRMAAKLEQILEVLPEDQRFRAVQVKEKFGGLRFYTDGKLPDAAIEIIGQACREADKTCEDCGEPGILRESRPWIRTLCDKCKEAYQGRLKAPGPRTQQVSGAATSSPPEDAAETTGSK